MPRFVFWIGGFFWGLLCLYAGFYLTFPSGEAAARLAWEVQEKTRGNWQVQAESVRPWLLTGASLEGVRLFQVPRRRGAEEPAANLVLQAADLSARAELLPLIKGAWIASINADLYGGELTGRAGMDGKVLVLDLEGEELDLSLYPFGSETWTLEAGGLLQMDMDLKVDQEDIKASEGGLALSVDGLSLAGLSISGFTLGQDVQFTTAELEFEVEEGRAKVKKGDFQSELIQLEVGGEITLVNPLPRSRLNLDITFKLGEELDKMASMMLKSARDEEGKYHYKLSGTLNAPKLREDRIASRGSVRRPTTTSRAPTLREPLEGEPPAEEPAPTEDNGSFRESDRMVPMDRRRVGDDRRRPGRLPPDMQPPMPHEPPMPEDLEPEQGEFVDEEPPFEGEEGEEEDLDNPPPDNVEDAPFED